MKINHSSSKIRRGLVLAGGGAKGAYAFGCLLALKKMGYKFEVVSGTSVGALNAALWSTNSLKKGFKLWRNISFSTVFPVRLANRSIPNWLIWIISTIQLSIQLVAAVIGRQKHLATIPISLSITIAHAIFTYSLYVSLSFLLQDNPEVFWRLAAFIVILNGISLYLSIVYQYEETDHLFFIGPFLSILAATYQGIGLPIYNSMSSRGIGALVGTTAVWFILFLVLIFVFIPLYNIIRWVLKILVRLTIFSTEALEKHIREIISKKWECTTIVTTASATNVVDLSEPIQWISAVGDKNIDQDIRCMYDSSFKRKATRPLTYRNWCPLYEDVSDCTEEDAVNFLLASAALPFGLAPSVRIYDKIFVDGGVVDNVPWYPLIEYELDEVVIILLEHFYSEKDALNSIKASRAQWLEHRINEWNCRNWTTTDPVLPEEQEEKESRIRLEAQRRISIFTEEAETIKFPNFRVIFPKSDLGGVVGGLLNFKKIYSRELIRRGISDVKLAFQSINTD